MNIADYVIILSSTKFRASDNISLSSFSLSGLNKRSHSMQTNTRPKNPGQICHPCKPKAAVRPNNSNPTSPLEPPASNAEIPQSEDTVLDPSSHHVFGKIISAFSDLVAFDRNYLFDLEATSEVVLRNLTMR